MASVFPAIGWRRWIEYLVAVLIGNAIYYLSLTPHLPPAFRHDQYNVDPGMLLDFAICVGVYWLMRLGIKLSLPSKSQNTERLSDRERRR